MRKDKEKAYQLRHSGKSYSEIYEILKVPRSTLSDWFSKEEWSSKIKDRLATAVYEDSKVRLVELNRIRGENLKRVYEEARREAKEEFEHLKYNPLFIAGLMLYWGEGDKVGRGAARLTNTDSEMMKLFVFFLQRICGIPTEKIGVHLLVYPDLNEPELRVYWSNELDLPEDNFTKSTVIIGKHPTKRLGFGICIVYVSSTYFKVKILEWLRLLPKQLMDTTYYENICSQEVEILTRA